MPHAPAAALEKRHGAVRHTLGTEALDALVVTALPNIAYLTNFAGSSAIVVLTSDRLIFLTDFRYVAALEETRHTDTECPGLELAKVAGSYDARLVEVLGGLHARRVGFEAAHLTVSRHRWVREAVMKIDSPPELVETEGIVERARVRKDAYELSVLKEAATRLSDVTPSLLQEARRGRSERDIATAMDYKLLRAGFEKTAFDTIVASGPNAALPHARPTERKLTEGDLVVLDFGGIHDSYCVDLTRMVVVGRASDRAREVHAAVAEAHASAVRAVRPGASRFAIDAAARDTLGRRGMADAFGHGTGHGLGLEVHEDPKITKRRPDVDASDESVDVGMVFTIEPGAYFPGWGGVRIEDDVVVTESGVEMLTGVTTDLIEI
jgi:Xaa-Pro aminopeptidase